MKRIFFLLTLLIYTLTFAQDYQSNGAYVIMEAEDLNLTGAWSTATATSGFSGSGYIVSSTENFLGENAGNDVISVQIKINTAGTYRVQMRTAITSGVSTTDNNDVWLRFPDADNFYANDLGNGDGIGAWTVYPRGSGKTPLPEGETDKGWFKIYMNTLAFNWTTYTSDNNPHNVYAVFDSPGVYHMEISNRSANHGIDRIALWNIATGNGTTATNTGTALTPYTLSGSTGNGAVAVTGELKNYHKTTFTFNGPYKDEKESTFTDNRFNVTFTSPTNVEYVVPGYFAADGNAANTGATEGDKWRVNFTPTEEGVWSYTTSFRTGTNVAASLVPTAGTATAPLDNLTDTFTITATDKTGDDFRSKGKLQYVDGTFLQFSNGEYFYKIGADSPEVFLEFADFDNTYAPTRTYPTHVADWVSGDPTWDGTGKGKGIIGVVNYLASLKQNVHYFLTMNTYGDGGHGATALGDGGEVSPFIGADAFYRYDTSKLGQWQIVFDEMMEKGIMPHMVLSEQENQSYFEDREGGTFSNGRKIYFREMAARFGYLNAVTWNIGEESGWASARRFGTAVTEAQQEAFAAHMDALAYYKDNIVIHNGPSSEARNLQIFNDLLGATSFTGIAFQGDFDGADGTGYDDAVGTYDRLIYYRNQSASAGKPWVITYDEPWSGGLLDTQTEFDNWRKQSLWLSVMAGTAGIELYYGGSADLTQQNYRDFATLWNYQRYAKELFYNETIPLQELTPDNSIVNGSNYALKDNGNRYLIYAPSGGTPTLTTGDAVTYDVRWYDPRNGGTLQNGSVTSITGGTNVSLGTAPNNTTQDWVVYVNNPASSTTGMNGTPVVPPSTTSSLGRIFKIGNTRLKLLKGSGSLKISKIASVIPEVPVGLAYEIPNLAFPTLVGQGRNTTGGEDGGTIIEVTNLNDSGPGSFRAAMDTDTKRIIHFSVSGNIVLQSPINIGSGVGEGDLTIAGETAPGKGVAIVTSGTGSFNGSMTSVFGDNAIMRFVRYRRLGEEPGSNAGNWSIRGVDINNPSSNIVVDHCTFGWSSDDLLGAAFGASENVTISHNLFHESTLKVGGTTGKGVLWYAGNKNTSFYGNLFVHVETRAPAISNYWSDSKDDVINNVVYNRKSQGMALGIRDAGYNTTFPIDGTQAMNIIGNKYIVGANTFTIGSGSPRYDIGITSPNTGDASAATLSYYVENNLTNTRTSDSDPEWDIMGYDPNNTISAGGAPTSLQSLTKIPSGFEFDRIVDVSEVEDFVLANAGVNIDPDATRTRLINDVINRTGQVPATEPAQFPFSHPSLGSSSWTYKAGTLIPETWANEHGITSNDQIKSNYVIDGVTFTNPHNKTAYQVWRFDRAGDLARLVSEGTPVEVSTIFLQNNDLKAFPTAEGFGKNTTGGRGGQVIKVTNLNDSGTGSLRNAIDTSGPRTIIFDVAGDIIPTGDHFGIYNSQGEGDLTIYGQSAPSPGITIRGDNMAGTAYGGAIDCGASNIIMQYISVRVNDDNTSALDAIRFRNDAGMSNIMVDHVSLSNGSDENFGFKGVTNSTVSNSMITDATTTYTYLFGQENFNHSFIGNYMSHTDQRNVLVGYGLNGETSEWINNVTYGYSEGMYLVYGNNADVMGNVYKPFPGSPPNAATITWAGNQFNNPDAIATDGSFYVENNYLIDPQGQSLYNGNIATYGSNSRVITNSLINSWETSISAIENRVFGNNVGNSLHRDSMDTEAIANYTDGGGSYNSLTVPNKTLATRPAGYDTDNDGLSDVYESAQGGNVTQSDRPATAVLKDGRTLDQTGITNYATNGYTHLEIFMADIVGDWDSY